MLRSTDAVNTRIIQRQFNIYHMEKRGGRGWENFGNVSIKFIDPPIRLCNILMTHPPPRQQLVGSQFSLQTLLATTDPPSILPQNHETPPPPSTSSTSSLAKKFCLVLCNPILLVILCLAELWRRGLVNEVVKGFTFNCQIVRLIQNFIIYLHQRPVNRVQISCDIVRLFRQLVILYCKKKHLSELLRRNAYKRKQLDDN